MAEASRPTGDWAAQLVKQFALHRKLSRSSGDDGDGNANALAGPCPGCASTAPAWAALLGTLSAHDQTRLPSYEANPEWRALIRTYLDELELQNALLRPLGVERRVLCYLDARQTLAFPAARAYNAAAPARRDALDELRLAAPIRCCRGPASRAADELRQLTVPARKLAGVLALYRARRELAPQCERLREKLPDAPREALAAQESPVLESARLLHALRSTEGPGMDVERLHATLPPECQVGRRHLRALVRAADALAFGRQRTPSSMGSGRSSRASSAASGASAGSASSAGSAASFISRAWARAASGLGVNVGELDTAPTPAPLQRLSWRRVTAQAAGVRAQGGPRAWGAKDKHGERWRRNPVSGAWEKITLRLSMHRRPNGEPDFVHRIESVAPAAPDFEPDF